MAAKGPSVEMTQAMFRHDGILYKVMAVGSDDAANSIKQFIDSLSINTAELDSHESKQPSVQPDTPAVQDLGGGIDVHDLSKNIGGAGALLALGLLAFIVLRGKRRKDR